MLELKTIEELKPNTKLLELIKDFTYKEQINKEKLLELEKDYTIMSLEKMENNQSNLILFLYFLECGSKSHV